MDYPAFLHHGATQGVTGSCHRYLADDQHHLLIDCGLFQGTDAGDDPLQQHRIEFDISAVLALIVTHVHIDHVGRLPYLMAAGFTGPIICSEPSARLLPLVIEDALRVGFTRDARLIERFLQTVEQQLHPLPYGQWHTLLDTPQLTVRVRLQRAGHILGSVYVEIDRTERAGDGRQPGQGQRAGGDKRAGDGKRNHRTVFSGDLGAPYTPLLPAPRSPYRADALVIESTYGNRQHENRRERRQRLQAVLERALQEGGTVMIPAFSIGRTQELLYELEGLIHNAPRQSAVGIDWQRLRVVVDSPLAARFTSVYRELKPFWDAEAQRRLRSGRHPLNFENLFTVDSHEQHEQMVSLLTRDRQPTVVIAASGMAAGGRIVAYLQALLADPQHTVLFVGYQAQGTPGRQLQQIAAGARRPVIDLEGKRVAVRANIQTIGGYSAHADQRDLLNFVKRMRVRPQQVRIVHGDNSAKRALQSELQALLGEEAEVVIPGPAPN